MIITTRTYTTNFPRWLYDQWQSAVIEPDDQWVHSMDREGFARFGRRVLVDNCGELKYTRHSTVAGASTEMVLLHQGRQPDYQSDGIIGQDWNEKYSVSLEGCVIGSAEDYIDAKRLLAQSMLDDGTFPDAFHIDNRGRWYRIDDAIRDLHDASGTTMKDE